MSWNGPKQPKVFSLTSTFKMSENVQKCPQISQNISKCPQMSKNISKCLKMSSNGQYGQKQPKIFSSTSMFKMSKISENIEIVSKIQAKNCWKIGKTCKQIGLFLSLSSAGEDLPDLSLSALQKRFTIPSELEELYKRYEQRFQVGKS